MKKKGVSFIEIVVSLAIFLIAILPIIYLTLNSLNSLRASSEVEDKARITTNVINYIKSRGYTYLDTNLLTGGSFSGNYYLSYDDIEGSYVVVDESSGSISSVATKDFETDFYGSNFNTTSTTPDALFFMSGLGIDLDGARIDISMEKRNLLLVTESGGTYSSSSYENPRTSNSTNILIGSGGIIEDEVIYGIVKLNYSSKVSTNPKTYEQTFVVVPIENYNN